MSVWVVLIGFGVVSMTSPEWLERAARRGRAAEAQAYRHYGDNELKKGNLGLAIAQYLHSLKILPDQPEVCLNLGIAYLRSGDLSRAESSLQRASQVEITAGLESFVSLHLGEIGEQRGRDAEAIRYYHEALRQGARADLVYRKLGMLYLSREEYLSAREAFEATLREQTDLLLPYREMLRRAREDAEEDAEIRQWLEAEEAREPDEGDWTRYDLESIRGMQRSDPEIAKTHNHLALIAYRMGEREAAIRHFEESLAIWPNNADASRNLQILKAEPAGVDP
jgi:tetratricopeptide (TPR) repeat protein